MFYLKNYDSEQNKILILFILFFISALLISFAAIQYSEIIRPWVSIFWVTLLSNSFIAIPHEPFYIEMGKSNSIPCLLILSIIPTIMGCMLDYLFLKPFIFSKRFNKIRNHRLIDKYSEWFRQYPGLLIIIFAISPLPFYVVRIFSLVTNYPFIKYALFSLSGRAPRYFILAMFGFSLKPPTWSMVVLFILLFSIPWFVKLLKIIYKSFSN